MGQCTVLLVLWPSCCPGPRRRNSSSVLGGEPLAQPLSSLRLAAWSPPASRAPAQPLCRAHAADELHGKVNVIIWSIDSDGPDFQAILSGAIGDYGPAVTVLPDGKVDPQHTNELELDLRQGTFRLYIDSVC